VPTPVALSRDNAQTCFDKDARPALEVAPGTIVAFETGDETYARLAAGESLAEIGMGNVNRVTGPVAVAGAEPGDVLSIEVLDIRIERAWTAWMPDVGALGHWVDTAAVRELRRRDDGMLVVNETIAVPLRPSIGCIGVAPASAPGSTMSPAGPWGGNMDLRELAPGATLLLPVQVDGALLSLGDLHAAMGAGEPTGAGYEAAGVATVRLDVVRGLDLPFPRIRTAGATICVGMDETHPMARRRAMEQAHRLLVERGLEPLDAYAYASAEVELRLGGPASAIVLAVVRFP